MYIFFCFEMPPAYVELKVIIKSAAIVSFEISFKMFPLGWVGDAENYMYLKHAVKKNSLASVRPFAMCDAQLNSQMYKTCGGLYF